ncbi:SRPBCC family protein [Falsirhodobacter xinxiangensis]|uniref:SRPBCC family protein n=1 Tax=Falsirhodobacter xinxiangensis TaxID=2530049 RepID=UPI0010A9D0F9|nr:SRPBCC family protein [Rhodobacter xinxiangensis]
MKFTTKSDIEAPLDFAFAALTDFDRWERSIRRRGATVSRIETEADPAPVWKTEFTFRGKPRSAIIRLVQSVPDKRLVFVASGASLDAQTTLDLIALTPKRTRLAIVAEMKPNSLAARLFIQSLRLARGKVQKRFDDRAAQLADEVSDRYRTV